MRDPTPGATATSINHSPHALTFRVMRLTTPLPSRTNAPPIHPTDDGNPLPLSLPLTQHKSDDVSAPSSDPVSSELLSAGDDTASPSPAHPASDQLAQKPPTPELLRSPPPWQAEGAPCGVGTLTILPSSFGSIYASETFRSFTSIFNRSVEPVYNISIVIHMQTASSRRIPLHDTSASPRAVLSSRASINNIVAVGLPELGLHVLVCSATYHETPSPTAEPRTLRQVFRFNVLPPLDPSVSVHALFHPHDPTPLPPALTRPATRPSQFLVHLRVHNALPLPVYEARAAFTPAPQFASRACDRDTDDTTLSSFDPRKPPPPRRATMAGGDTRTFIFHVFSRLPARVARAASLDHPLAADAPAPPASPMPRRVLGSLTLTWRSALGEPGRLERAVYALDDPGVPDRVAVALYAIPADIRVHRPFVARCVARNNSDRPLRLYLQIRRDLVGEIVPVGVSGVSLGEVAPRQTAKCAITLIALERGQHNISGVRVVDIDTNMSYKAEPPSVSVL